LGGQRQGQLFRQPHAENERDLGPTVANNVVNAFGDNVNTRTITMESGSLIIMRVAANYTFNQNITLLGPATLFMTESTNGHKRIRTFASPISGAFALTLRGGNGNTVNLSAANSFSSLNMTADDRYQLFLNVAGAAGTGDVTMGRRAADARGGSLVINSAGDTIADTATLTLNNIGYDGTTSDGAVPRAMVVMNENETVGALVVNGPGAATLRFLSGDSTLKVNGTATFNGPSANMQIFNTAALTVGGLTFNNNAGWNITDNTVTIDTSGGGSGIIAANVDATIASKLAGEGFTKTGAGTLVLSNSANTYSGATNILGGTLALGASGSISSSSSVLIGVGGEFDTTALSFTMLGSQPFTWNIDPTGAGSAGLLDASILNITSGNATFNALAPLDDAFYIVANYTSLIGLSFASSLTPTGYVLDYNFNNLNQIALVQRADIAVPEPATATLGLLGLAGLMMCRRRMA